MSLQLPCAEICSGATKIGESDCRKDARQALPLGP